MCSDLTPNLKKSFCSDMPFNPFRATHRVRVSWDIKEGDVINRHNTIHLHPVHWCRAIRESFGSDIALDHLKGYLHERIDQIFNRGNCHTCNTSLLEGEIYLHSTQNGTIKLCEFCHNFIVN